MKAYVITEPELLEILDRVEIVADRIDTHFPYSETILKKVANQLYAIMNNEREVDS